MPSTRYQIIAATKLQRRSQSHGKRRHSIWQISFRCNTTRESFDVCYAADSNPAQHRFHPRRDRYATCGGFSTFKKLTALYRKDGESLPSDLPVIGVKSFNGTHHDPKYLQYPWPSLPQLKASMLYYKMQGIVAFAGKHHHQSHSHHKPFLILQDLDWKNCLHFQLQAAKSSKSNCFLTNEQQQRAFVTATCRLIARLEFFHKAEGRPFLDLKAENIMLEFGPKHCVKQLNLIDIDGSIGTQLTTSKHIHSRVDLSIVKALYTIQQNHPHIEKSALFHRSDLILDWRSLSKLIARTCADNGARLVLGELRLLFDLLRAATPEQSSAAKLLKPFAKTFPSSYQAYLDESLACQKRSLHVHASTLVNMACLCGPGILFGLIPSLYLSPLSTYDTSNTCPTP